MKRRILSLALAVAMVAMLMPMMTVTANISAANRGIGIPYIFTQPDWWPEYGYGPASAGQHINFDLTSAGNYTLTLPPWQGGNGTFHDGVGVHLMRPVNSTGHLSVTVSISVNGTARISNATLEPNGGFWSQTAGTRFGGACRLGVNMSGFALPGEEMVNHLTPSLSGNNPPMAIHTLEISGSVASSLAPINSGDIVAITFSVGTGVRYGHVRNASDITAADVTLLRGYIASQDKTAFRAANPSFNLANADVNGDGFVNSADITLLRRYVAAVNKDSVPLGPAPVPRPDLGGTPTITGTARVGSTLTAGTANITPNGIGGLIYNWQRSNSAGNGWENPGAARTNSTYVPVAADVGRTIRVQVSSSNANGTRNSAETTAVAQAALGGTASVSGTARVGTTLTAGTGSITPSGIGGFRYQWQRTGTGSNNTYSDITGATSSTYVPVTGDVDRLIRVLVTSSNATGTITSSATSQRVQNQNQQAQYLICLTFDDGPTGSQTSGATFDVLQLLDRHGAKGSFYVNGSKINATTRPLLQRMVRDGHSVENHSWNHPNFGTLTQAQARTQIVDTTNAIVNATGVTPFSFRAPFFDWGGSNNSLLGLDVELNLAFHNAGMDTDDWEAARTATMITDGILYGTNRTYNGAQNGRANGGVVLMHDGSSTAKICQSMDVFIPQMKQWGYEFVTIRDLHERTNSGPQRFSGNGMWPRVNDWVPPQTAGSNTALWSTWPVGTRYNR